ncbi:unnamed protein product, partial [Ilex paraguariensis]
DIDSKEQRGLCLTLDRVAHALLELRNRIGHGLKESTSPLVIIRVGGSTPRTVVIDIGYSLTPPQDKGKENILDKEFKASKWDEEQEALDRVQEFVANEEV